MSSVNIKMWWWCGYGHVNVLTAGFRLVNKEDQMTIKTQLLARKWHSIQ